MGNMKKVVHLIASSGLYGAEKWILALMRAMEGSAIDSTLVNFADVRGGMSSIVSGAQERGLRAVDFYTGGTFNPYVVLRFSKWLKRNDINIVHGHGYKSDLVGFFSAKLAGCKIISTPHGWSTDAGKKLQFYEWLDRHLFRFMDCVCPLSEDLCASIKCYSHPDKIKLILNGVDIEEVAMLEAKASFSDDTFVIGYVGQLIKRKNLQSLIKALQVLRQKKVNARVIILGEGSERESLETLASSMDVENFIDFLGYRTDAISIMKTFDAFVLPSLLEGIPRCIMEAMAAGVPVVASDIAGNRDIVTHGETGLLFPALDGQALADALLFLMSNRPMGTLFSENAARLIKEKYSNHRMAVDYAAVYSKL